MKRLRTIIGDTESPPQNHPDLFSGWPDSLNCGGFDCLW